KLCDVGRVLDRSEEQHAVRAYPEVRVTEALDPQRRQLRGKRRRLDDQVVIAQGLPLLELHVASSRSTISAATAPSSRSVRSSRVTPSILRIHVSWRRA